MKIAVIAVTRQGAAQAGRVAAGLSRLPGVAVDVILPQKFAGLLPGAIPYSGKLAGLLGRVFGEYNAIVAIMALGIVFRLLAPQIRDKRQDPAVVVMDEGGRFAISALSGHLGGANDLARHLEKTLGTTAVITTATDVHGLAAVDSLARAYGLVMEPFALVREVNAAIVNGEPVTLYTDLALEPRLTRGIAVLPLSLYQPGERENGRVVLVTDNLMADAPPGTLFLRPKNLIAGIGCRTGASPGQVRDGLLEALKAAGKSSVSIACLATVDLRAGERGLLETAAEWGVPLKSFTREEIKAAFVRFKDKLSFSPFVFQQIGVGGVCEPVAMLAAPEADLILPKMKRNGVTVALAEAGWPLSAPGRANWPS